MAVQDDRRQTELILLFNLRRPDAATRSGLDAFLEMDGLRIPFELKSTTTGNVTTVRDMGPDHILKWAGQHWLIGVYGTDGTTLRHCLYGSPRMMRPWIAERSAYIAADFRLAELVPRLLDLDTMDQVLGRKDSYTLQDARGLHKNQYSTARYRQEMDLTDGYSRNRMLSVLRDRCSYLISRGSTLNNPHIPSSYFRGWERITADHAGRLRALVREELAAASADATEQATE